MTLVDETFDKDVSLHEMTIEQDSGVYRCISFKNPSSINYHFRLTTWPGHLAISGDMGDFMFCRLQDMFEFFRGPLSVGYWKEKCVAGETEEFDAHSWGDFLSDLLDQEYITKEQKEELSGLEPDNPYSLVEALDQAGVADAWEYGGALDAYTHQFLWCLRAIQWGIAKYDASKELS
jgi:hypothetical protein